MKNVLVIHETDHEDKESIVIGVASSTANADKLIDGYYGGRFVVIDHRDIRDSDIEWEKDLAVTDHNGDSYWVTVGLEWFEIDAI